MARSRNIKPGFFSNEYLAELSFATRLLFIGLWTEADREGRLEDRPRRLKMALFPADSVDVDKMLSELDGLGFIKRYAVDGVRVIQVVNWAKHQNPHVKEAKSNLPGLPEIEPSPVETVQSTVQAPDKNSSIPADSLSLDSGFLIPDPLTPSQAPASARADLFASFWKLYPRKTDKAKAQKAWDKLRPDQPLFEQIMAGLGRHCASRDWLKDDGQFIPHPTTWLNGKRWEDEVKPAGNVHHLPASRHTGFAERDYTKGLQDLGDGTYGF